MKTISIVFDEYWREINKNYIPEKSGIYCVYRCTYNKPSNAGETGTINLKELIYIGEARNVRERIATHDKLEHWRSV